MYRMFELFVLLEVYIVTMDVEILFPWTFGRGVRHNQQCDGVTEGNFPFISENTIHLSSRRGSWDIAAIGHCLWRCTFLHCHSSRSLFSLLWRSSQPTRVTVTFSTIVDLKRGRRGASRSRNIVKNFLKRPPEPSRYSEPSFAIVYRASKPCKSVLD